MVWKKLKAAVSKGVSKVRRGAGVSKKKLKGAKGKCLEYPNRFLKFYHSNQKRLLKERKKLYHQKLDAGICVRCNNQALDKIKFCSYHQERQREYNLKARMRRKKKEVQSV
ncbi:hypothetical protein HOC01_03000 [archaeon]|jgi:hypothetical protein|nr:hypothetical protein [archaeon]MBT6698142.1 hypothetical protein [archaeon]